MASFIEKPRTTCALGGALAVISSLPDVIPISHTTSGCAGNLSGATAFNAGYCGSSYCSGQSVPVSNITEQQVVFGGTNRLREEIRSTFELLSGKLYVVLTGCMTEIIADDMYGVVQEFREDGKEIMYVNTPSFEGDAYHGYDLVLNKIFNEYLPVSKRKNKKLVNIFGIVPLFDPYFRGDLAEIKRLLEKLGLTVNTFFTGDQTFENIKSAPKAALNILFSPVYGLQTVKSFQQKHGTPYLQTMLPVGALETEEFLKQVAEALELEKESVNKVLREEKKNYYSYIERSVDLIADSEFKYYANVVGNGNAAVPYAAFLERELGWVMEHVIITDFLTKKKKEEIREAYQKQKLSGELIFETDAYPISRVIKESIKQSDGEFYFDNHMPMFVFGSTFEKDFLQKLSVPLLQVSYPVYDRAILNKGYAGYEGGLRLLEDILNVLVSGR